uniref:Uncharacterized protein n=1 Tax=viral metagenome TaxID=1070528 RepID=A0A6C0DMS8_9ZZZZ
MASLVPQTFVLYSKPRFISFPDVSAVSTTFETTSDVLVPPLSDGEYTAVLNDTNTVLHSAGEVKMSLYTDASGTVFAVDSSGNPIDNKSVITTIYTYPYTDASGNAQAGYLTTYFSDGTYFGNNDLNNAAYWYTFYGLDQPPKQYT